MEDEVADPEPVSFLRAPAVIDTKLGTRRLDILTQEGLAIESKVGRTSLRRIKGIKGARLELFPKIEATTGHRQEAKRRVQRDEYRA